MQIVCSAENNQNAQTKYSRMQQKWPWFRHNDRRTLPAGFKFVPKTTQTEIVTISALLKA